MSLLQALQNTLLLLLFLTLLLSSLLFLKLSTTTNNNPTLPSSLPPPYPHPFIHIVKTRFLQDQGHLTSLAKARLLLFQHFCLPTMIHQTTSSFLWIIKTDPNLDPQIKSQLIALLSPHKNFYLVGSNRNYGIGRDASGWRGGDEGADIFNSEIYTGDVSLLRSAHIARRQTLVIETRLDADDGLHARFLSDVQTHIRESKKKKKNKWMYYCQSHHVEWYPSSDQPAGRVLPKKGSDKVCITPGLTLALSSGVNEEDVPRYPHHRLYKNIIKDTPDCGGEGECIRMINTGVLSSVRCRSPTSAGMKDIRRDIGTEERPWVMKEETVWKILEHDFFIVAKQAKLVNQYLKEHMMEIAKDNLKGQCTEGHSCKLSSKEKLLQMIELMGVENGEGMVSVETR